MQVEQRTVDLASCMEQLLRRANWAARRHQEVPVAAALLDPNGRLLAVASNRCVRDGNSLRHAEWLVMQAAMRRLGRPHLQGCTLVVTLEPCWMCSGAVLQAQLSHVVFAAPSRYGLQTCLQLWQDWPGTLPLLTMGIAQKQSQQLLQQFFAKLRSLPPMPPFC